jgi:Protein of unknown function (DUF3421)
LIVMLAPWARSGLAQSLDWQTFRPGEANILAYAINVGQEDHLPLYACRARSGDGTQTGRYRSDFTGCHIGYAGQEISVQPFEVLTAAWQGGTGGSVPPGALVAGQRPAASIATRFDLAPLYPCHAAYQDSIQVGEIAAGDPGCRFGYGGRQVTMRTYEVLWQSPWMSWVPGTIGQIPPDAVIAGKEGGEPFYVCRAGDSTGVHPGKIKQSSPGCAFASDGAEGVAGQFAVLVPRWVAGDAGTIPVSALPVGNEKHDLIYLCRAQVHEAVQIGKITDKLPACHIGMMGKENTSPAYEVLSAP